MTRLPRRLAVITLCGSAAAVAAGCGNATDVTSAKMDHDVAVTYANYLRLRQTAEGHPPPAARPAVTARCGRGDRLAASTGAGKDWQCVITVQMRGHTTRSRYDVVARPTACYTATSPNFAAQKIRAADATSIDNPLYQFDGCLPG